MPILSWKKGFSLVELSIVLVILGLLTGGILAGQSLIRAAELRGVVEEYQRFSSATRLFQDKYFSVPGDMKRAADFWKLSTACSGTVADGVCNGNGDGQVNWGSNTTAGLPDEDFQFWRHLTKAGLLEGDYTGIAGSLSYVDCDGGKACPVSRVSNAYWGTRHYNSSASVHFALPTGKLGNHFIVGALQTNGWPQDPVFRPDEAWNLDRKLDDGMPAYGKVLAVFFATCTTASVRTDLAAGYNLNNTTIPCALWLQW